VKILAAPIGAIGRHPGRFVLAWLALTAAFVAAAPDLTRLAAEGQARLVPDDSESARARAIIHEIWPDQAFQSAAVLALHRPGGLTDADRNHARQLEAALADAPDRPAPLLRVVGPGADPEVADRLLSRDRSLQLLVFPLDAAFVAPAAQEAVGRLEAAVAARPAPDGLERRWTGDAVVGRDYMRDVQTSLDRAAVVTLGLLLVVLLFVYRSPWLAAIPLATIAVGLLVSRSVLAWMAAAGWEISPLVELFLVVILFGCGTDFCLFLSWRFAEHFDPADPAGAMADTLRSAFEPIATSAGTVIVGLALMGTTRFKLFSSTGPSVALGLAMTLLACLTLTPALLVVLARRRPRAFAWLARDKTGGVWEAVGHAVLRRPGLAWLATLVLMAPLAVLGTRTHFVQDLLSEMPSQTPARAAFGLIAEKFGPGTVAPLSLVIRSPADLRGSEGLALLDDLSRLLARQKGLAEVRSATQPLGSTEPLAPARLGNRLGQVNDGFARIEAGARQLRQSLIEGAAKLRTALQLRRATGIDLTTDPASAGGALARLLRGRRGALDPDAPAASAAQDPRATDGDPREAMVRELARAADGADQIAEGARQAREEVGGILADPVGRRALDRLLINRRTIAQNPELNRGLDAYLSPDGHVARIDLVQADRFFSTEAMAQVGVLRRAVRDFLANQDEVPISGLGVAGANAESADIWAITQRDQIQTWLVVPLGVFLILLVALRNPAICANLVLTMVLTYLFALGATHLVFVTWGGAEGLDWKVPLFLFVLLIAVGVDYNIFLMSRLTREAREKGLRPGIAAAIGQTGGLITSAAAITACSFASFLTSPLASIRQLGFALVVGIAVDALLVRPILVPCGHWLLSQGRNPLRRLAAARRRPVAPHVGIGRG
jgi:RND superfamily putative drug exporter